MSTRSRRMLELLKNLNLPKYETTKGSTKWEQELAIQRKDHYQISSSKSAQAEGVKDSDLLHHQEEKNEDTCGEEYAELNYDVNEIWSSNKIETYTVTDNGFLHQSSDAIPSTSYRRNDSDDSSYSPSHSEFQDLESETDSESDVDVSELWNSNKTATYTTNGSLHESSEAIPSTSYSRNDGDDDSSCSPSHSEFQDSESEIDAQSDVPMDPSINFQEHTSNIQAEISTSRGTSKLENKVENDQQNKLEVLLQNEVQVEQARKKHYKDKLDLCKFCDKDVSHFARHVFTWHSTEFDVQRILSYPQNSKQRRQALSLLRKQGNFIKNRSSTTIRPVKRIPATSEQPADEYLPCSHCFGFYKKKYPYRHTKCCPEKSASEKCKRQTSQSDGHSTLLLGTLLKHDELLKKELFPRMRSDEINMVVKKDFLICDYGYSYLKGRRSKGNLDLVRQYMRRLAKLLKIARLKNNSIKELIDVLSPSYFKLIIEGVSQLARYNPDTDTYDSPTLAMNFGKLLKKCCDLAYIHLLQKPDTNDQRKGIKILKTLIESQWANEISAQVATNLKEKKWNKFELIPLTAELKKLNEALETMAHETYNHLKLHPNDKSSYSTFKEVLYCQIILLNRRRPAEVAQLKVDTYQSINLEVKNGNEFESCLTETEKILLHSYSRIVIRGKRGRGVPVLLSPKMKTHFEYLIEIRINFVANNDYVFHTGGSSFVDGTKILYKYAKKCGIENPQSISATKLRKHLATVTQLLNFSTKDLEQLSNFMGHTLNTHCNFYRLPDNLYQTAKVSKLLLLMSQGGAEQFKGMQLDDININLEALQKNEEPFVKLLENISKSQNSEVNDSSQIEQDDLKVQNVKIQKKVIKQLPKVRRINWEDNHKSIIARYFAEHIKNKRVPKRHEVEQLINTYPQIFEGKAWTSIKAVVYNIYTGKLKVSVV